MNKIRTPKIIDSHSHSDFSPDSKTKIEEMVAVAASQGLAGIAITDHLDLKVPDGDTRFTFDIAIQQQEIDKLRASYNSSPKSNSELKPNQNSFKILKGIEIGLQPHNLKEIKEYLKGYKFDTIIASIHFVDGVDPYHGDYYKGLTEKKAYGRYLELFHELITAYPDFDVLGHYDYIARYAPYENCTILYKDYSDIFDSIFKYLAYNGKALEINTNTYRTRNGKTPTLDPHILKRYLDLGGEFITIGSDAHTPDRIAEEFSHYLKMMYDCGFKYVTHYNERKPIPQRF
ncbi:MAG: histidinol-phosphatase HisJ family protein [Bacteroidales bacterium]